ncbi:MAG TPA: hypothetical protein VK886_21420 [Vicinamibacterales bacterium]|nr:hypothetical protein [Vicinamibacterales bacterium]
MADTDRDHPLQPKRPNVPPEAQPRSAESHPAHVTEPEDHAVAHEESDVNVRAIVIFTLALFVVGAIVHLVLWGLMGMYARQAAAADPAVTPLAAPAGTPPPGPQLLRDEPAALRQLRNEEAPLLKDIERAKQAVVGTLPARAGGQAPPTPSRSASRMDSSSGRRQ